MNEHIENVLRKAPQPKAPAGLLEKLQADINLPRSADAGSETETIDSRPFLKRWLPALSFSALLLASLVAIAVQANVLSELRQENRQLQSAAAESEGLRRANVDSQAAEQMRLDQLRKDAAEVERLREEIAQLRAPAQELATLRAENQRLKATLQASANHAAAAGEGDPFAASKAKAEATQCISNLKQIGLAARMWSNDHGEVMPPDWLSMKNELNSPKILACPSDSGRTRGASWETYGAGNLSYEFLAFGISENEPPDTVMTRCPVHDHVGLLDGSVQGGAWKRAVQKDGRWILERKATRQ